MDLECTDKSRAILLCLFVYIIIYINVDYRDINLNIYCLFLPMSLSIFISYFRSFKWLTKYTCIVFHSCIFTKYIINLIKLIFACQETSTWHICHFHIFLFQQKNCDIDWSRLIFYDEFSNYEKIFHTFLSTYRSGCDKIERLNDQGRRKAVRVSVRSRLLRLCRKINLPARNKSNWTLLQIQLFYRTRCTWRLYVRSLSRYKVLWKCVPFFFWNSILRNLSFKSLLLLWLSTSFAGTNFLDNGNLLFLPNLLFALFYYFKHVRSI